MVSTCLVDLFMFTLRNLYIFNVVFGHQEYHVIYMASLTFGFSFP
jgi:hypothetical protein